VCITIPSSATLLQAETSLLIPSISTTQIRQAPISFISFKKQRLGICISAFSAASSIVVPSLTSI